MESSRLCEICGNTMSDRSSICPFCGSSNSQDSGKKVKKFRHRTVNLEVGRPVLEVALAKLDEVLRYSNRMGIDVLTLIHGYGSSGRGGVIRSECIKNLDYLKGRGQIRDYIPGEEYFSRKGPGKTLLRRFPRLKHDNNLNKGNKGVTLVIL